MKKISTLLIGIVFSIMILNSQVAPPQAFSLKATIKGSNGQLVPNRTIRLRISILQNNTNGIAVYSEYFTPTTDANSQVDLQIGKGTVLSGSFSSIGWSTYLYFLKIEVDIRGGTNYQLMSVTQLLSVPYAMYSGSAGNALNVKYSNITGAPILSTIATTGQYKDLLGKPTLAAVATSGSYNDLTNKPITDGSETKVTAGNNINVTGVGTTASPYLISSTGGGSADAVTLTGNQTITGIKTFAKDVLINGLAIGRGKGSDSTNTAIGGFALNSNTSGIWNTATGDSALYHNTTGSFNTANGAKALFSNTTGVWNTATGDSALIKNTQGSGNNAFGYSALGLNTSGNGNTAIGNFTLWNNTFGNENTAIGEGALSNNISGNYNTAIGAGAGAESENLTNSTVIGYAALVNVSNKVVIGNSNVTSIGGYANWTNYSDERLKENIVYKNDLGLNFINKLKTVSYNYKADQLKHRRDGLIAQDVDKALKGLGLQFSGLVTDDDKDKTMSLSYGDFVIPLINAVQEQQKQIEAQKKQMEAQNKQIEAQQKQIDELKKLVGILAQK